MKREDVSVCILRVGGTNCDAETKIALRGLFVVSPVMLITLGNRIIPRREKSWGQYVERFPCRYRALTSVVGATKRYKEAAKKLDDVHLVVVGQGEYISFSKWRYSGEILS